MFRCVRERWTLLGPILVYVIFKIFGLILITHRPIHCISTRVHVWDTWQLKSWTNGRPCCQPCQQLTSNQPQTLSRMQRKIIIQLKIIIIIIIFAWKIKFQREDAKLCLKKKKKKKEHCISLVHDVFHRIMWAQTFSTTSGLSIQYGPNSQPYPISSWPS